MNIKSFIPTVTVLIALGLFEIRFRNLSNPTSNVIVEKEAVVKEIKYKVGDYVSVERWDMPDVSAHDSIGSPAKVIEIKIEDKYQSGVGYMLTGKTGKTICLDEYWLDPISLGDVVNE